MSQTQYINQLEIDLWAAADNLRANSKLTSSEYCMPVLGIIFLRHATNRYDAVVRQMRRGHDTQDGAVAGARAGGGETAAEAGTGVAVVREPDPLGAPPAETRKGKPTLGRGGE